MLDYINKPVCNTLEEFRELLEKETLAERDRILKTAILLINREYSGTGVLKHSDGSDICNIALTFSYKDDGRYVYRLGSITDCKLTGTIRPDTNEYIEAKLNGVGGSLRIDCCPLSSIRSVLFD